MCKLLGKYLFSVFSVLIQQPLFVGTECFFRETHSEQQTALSVLSHTSREQLLRFRKGMLTMRKPYLILGNQVRFSIVPLETRNKEQITIWQVCQIYLGWRD